MVVQIDIAEKGKSKMKKGDLLVYDGKSFRPITQEELNKDIGDLRREIEVLRSLAFKSIKNINERNKRFLRAFSGISSHD